ncbi:MAG TPA: MFS transporter [Candidatus Baltobacteraceae bacterium]|nr:MFS transporter [Candidatus Baltobacteraceae bacterium]
MDRRGMALLGVSHVVDDMNQSALPALLPFLIAERGLSYTAAAGLMLFASIASSVVQPAIGHLADRRSMPWLIALGVFLAGAGLALAGAMPTYWLIVPCVALSGVGIAAFHPEAARFANYLAGAQKATGMRWFAVGGNVGFAAGPLLLTPLLVVFGTRGTLFVLLPASLMALAVLRELPRLRGFAPPPPAPGANAGSDRWGPFIVLGAFVSLRSMAYIGLVAFMPLYFIAELHASKPLANVALAAFLGAGALGTIYGGRLADRIGRRATLVASMLVAAPLLAGFLALATHGAGFGIALLAAMSVGFVLVASQTAMVVLGQEYLPNRLGIASGVTLGLAISLGGAGAPALGAIADRFGINATIEAIVGLLVLSLLTTFALPREAERSGAAREALAAPALHT